MKNVLKALFITSLLLILIDTSIAFQFFSLQYSDLAVSYKFNETPDIEDYNQTYNYAGNNSYNMTRVNELAQKGIGGILDYAYAFNNTGYLLTDQGYNLKDTGNWSISAWINLSSHLDGGRIFHYSNELPTLQTTTGNLEWIMALSAHGGEDTTIIYNLSSTQNNTWYHVALVANITHLKAYFNGSLYNVTEYTGSAYPEYSSAGFYAGFAFNGSLDELNIYNRSLTDDEIYQLYYWFYEDEYFESYENTTFKDTPTTLFLNASLPTTFNASSVNATLEYNHTNYTATLYTVDDGFAQFYTEILPNVSGTDRINQTHKWFVNAQTNTGEWEHLMTDEQNQSVYWLNLSTCNTINTHPILNISWKDQITKETLLADVTYDLEFTNTTTHSIIGNYSNTNNITFCTNLNPDDQIKMWDVTGTITISNDDYGTKIISLPTGASLNASNSPPISETYYLMTLGNSTTITYTWLQPTYDVIDGIMQIFTCEGDGTKTLLEQTPIISGTAHANIILTTQPYSYIVIVDGITYADESFNQCHIEYSTTATYYVTLAETGLEASSYKGITYYFEPSNDTLNNNTQYPFRFNLSSNYWDVTGAVFSLRDSDGNVLGIISGYNTTGTNLEIKFNTDNYTRIVGLATITTEQDTLSFQQIWTVGEFYPGSASLWNFFEDMRLFGEAGFTNFTRMLIAFAVIFALTLVASLWVGISNDWIPIGIFLVLTAFFSSIGWLYLDMAGIPDEARQYLVLILMTLLGIGVGLWRKI